MDKKKYRLKTMSEKRKKHIKYMIFIMKGKTKWSLAFHCFAELAKGN